MPLILVIESDRRQTSKLTMLARNQLRADLLIVDNVQQALAKLDECDPDLILTSSMMSGREQLALGERLLEIEEDGLRIQTLTMPQLGLAGQRGRMQKTAPGRAPVARGRAGQTDSMDPVVFGMQIATYLERIATERTSSDTVGRRRQPAVIETEESEALDESPSIEAPPPIEAKRTSARPDWSELLEAMRRDIEVAQSSTPPQQLEGGDARETSLDDKLAQEGIQVAPVTSRDALDTTASVTPVETPSAATEAPDAPLAAPVAAAAAPARKAKKVRRVPPQDEFGFFDPRQCGLSALYAKLDTITPPGKPATPKKPS